MNLRQPMQINKPLDNKRLWITDFFSDMDFNEWMREASVHIISMDYLVDVVSTTNATYRDSISNSNDSGSHMYSYRLKVIYQER